MKELTIAIEGMSCGHCVAQVERVLRDLRGVRVEKVRVGEARVAFEPGEHTVEEILAAVREAGYQATAGEPR